MGRLKYSFGRATDIEEIELTNGNERVANKQLPCGIMMSHALHALDMSKGVRFATTTVDCRINYQNLYQRDTLSIIHMHCDKGCQ